MYLLAYLYFFFHHIVPPMGITKIDFGLMLDGMG